MKLVVLYLLFVPTLVLCFSAVSVLLDSAKASILNPGPHGMTHGLDAFTSASNNNGSAFGGLTGNTDWFKTTLGLAMLGGRFLPIVVVLAIAGALAAALCRASQRVRLLGAGQHPRVFVAASFDHHGPRP